MAGEHEYFARHNAELIKKLRERLHIEERAAALTESTGITDAELMDHLARLGVTPDEIPVLHLAPLIEVAWADREIQPAERDLLYEAAAAHGLVRGTPAFETLERLLTYRPKQAFFDAATDFLRAVLLAMPEADAAAARADLGALAYEIAAASGGIFGVVGKIDRDERAALRAIADRLRVAAPDAARTYLEKV